MKLFKKKNEEPKEDLKITLPYMSTDWAWPFSCSCSMAAR